jgi:putative ABC transport system permease protein
MKQALAMIREEKLFSAIHIAGTALAIAFTMVMAVVYYIKLAPIYPEVNRARTLYFEGIRVVAENGGQVQMPFGQKALEEWFEASPNIEYCAPTRLACGTGKLLRESQQSVALGNGEFIEAVTNETNADFFKIYDYEFLEGRAFTKQEVEALDMVCVIGDGFAERLFGKGIEAVGKTVNLEDSYELRVVGVVRQGSQLAPDSYADLFMPYTLDNFIYRDIYRDSPYVGYFSIVATVKDAKHLKALRKELEELEARLTINQVERIGGVISFGEGVKTKVDLTSNLESHAMHALRTSNRKDSFTNVSNRQLIMHFAGLLFVLLFVPALNLCGIVAGRMERRTAEMAVRKAFGARRSTLLNQVVTENLVLTSIGGLIGLALSWLSIYNFRTELLGMFFDNSTLTSAPIVSGEMLFAPTLFLGAFVAVVVLNLLAAVVPAWWSLRKPIVESMMEKR